MRIIIPGEPIAQARLRFFTRCNTPQLYDPNKREKDRIKVFIKNYIADNYKDYTYPNNPKISFYFYHTIPTSMTKKYKQLAENGLIRKRSKPDCDNYVKLYLDCMNEIVFEDDSQVILGASEKFYFSVPQTVIYVDECQEVIDMPLGAIPHFELSCEWIRETISPHHESMCLPYSGSPRFCEQIFQKT